MAEITLKKSAIPPCDALSDNRDVLRGLAALAAGLAHAKCHVVLWRGSCAKGTLSQFSAPLTTVARVLLEEMATDAAVEKIPSAMTPSRTRRVLNPILGDGFTDLVGSDVCLSLAVSHGEKRYGGGGGSGLVGED